MGVLPVGPRNAIVDVPGVRVGHCTLSEDLPGDEALRTGVTAILTHEGDPFAEPVAAGVHVINGYGKPAGLLQIAELGTLESPVLVGPTLSVGPVWEGGLRWVLERNPEAGRKAGTVNVAVFEVFDGYLSDSRALAVRAEHAIAAIDAATADEIAEGGVGAGTGSSCLGFKGGVGTASRVVGDHTIGVLLVTNYGQRRDLHLLRGLAPGAHAELAADDRDPADGGSVVVIIATDAPLLARQLRRVAGRATFGLARAGSYGANASGEFALAFSTAQRVPRYAEQGAWQLESVRDDGELMHDLFQAAAEATEEAVLNALCRAETTTGRAGHRLEAMPYELLSGPGQSGPMSN